MFNLFQKKPAANQLPASHKQPNYPFDLNGYTCFSLINCPLEQAVQRAGAIGTIQIMHVSDNEGLPTRQELEKFMAQTRQKA